MHTTNRRDLIALVTIPSLAAPLPSAASPATPPDPVVPAFHEWQQRWREYDVTNKIHIEMMPGSPGQPEARA
ncbi:MAG: hypothetical protein AAGF76_12260 [Pseudomonadota bacterium]